MQDNEANATHLIRELEESRDRIARLEVALAEERNSRQRLNMALKSSNVGTWSWNIAEDTVSWDECMRTLFGMTSDTLVEAYQGFLNTMHPDDRQRVQREIAAAVEDGRQCELEYRIIWPNGSVHFIASQSTVYRDEHEQPAQMTSVCWDITEQKQAEKALQQSKAFLQTAIDTIPDPTLVTGRDYRIVLANKAARESIGGADPVSTRLTCYQVFHDRDTPCLEDITCPLKQIIASKCSVRVEHIHHDTNNNEIYVEIDAAPILDEAGEVIQIVEVFRDITDHKRAETALQRSEERFRNVVNACKDAIVAINCKGLVTVFNPAAEEMFGRERESMLAQSVDALIPEEYRQRHRQAIEGYFSSGEPSGFIGKTVELPALRSDGHVFPVTLSLSAAQIGDEQFVLATIRDITHRKQAEEKLRNEKEISEATLGSLPGVFYMFDEHGKFIRWNKNFEEVSGYSGDEISQMHPIDFIATQDKEHIAEKIQDVFTTGEATAEARFLTRDGQELPYFFTGVRSEIDGKTCLLGTGTDITERVATAKVLAIRARQQKVVAELGRYALSSHDLTNVMNEVVKRVAETLEVEYCKVLELLPGDQALLLRAGVGWMDGLVGKATVPTEPDSQAGYTLLSDKPVIVEDLSTERRFSGPALLQDHHVVSGMSVIIQGPEGPWGVLGAHTTLYKRFSKDDVNFLQAIANLLADAIARMQVEKELAASESNYREVFNAVNDMIVVHDKATGDVLDVNETYCRMYGYTPEEARQLAIGDFSLGEPPYSQEDAVGWVRKAVEEGPQLFKWVCKKKSGELFWVEVNLKLAVIGGEDRVLAVSRDISDRKKAEEALQQSEQRFRSLVETTSDWIWEMDRDCVYTYVSPKVKDLLGYEPEEVLGKTPLCFMPPHEAERVAAVFQEIYQSPHPFTQLENINLHKDGRQVVLETSGIPILDSDGNLKGYRCVDRDITERKLAEEALRTSEHKYRVLFEQSADATLVIDENEFVDCNDAAVKMLRYRNKEDLLRTHPSELSPERQPDGRSSFEKAEELMSIAFKKGSHRFEWDHMRADGEVFPVEVLLTAVPVGDKSILHVVWRDITKRKRAEEQIVGLAKFPQENPNPVLRVSSEGIVLFENKASSTLLHNLGCRVGTTIPAQWRKFVVKALETGETLNREFECGGLVFASTFTPIVSSKYVNIYAMDVTERKRIEEEREGLIARLEAQNAELERFTYTVSHDLKSPLITIRGHLGLLQEDLAEGNAEQSAEDMERIANAADKMHRLLQEVLELSRIGRVINPPEDVSLQDIVREATELVGGKIAERGVQITISPDLPILYGDHARLREVLQNLIENAVAHMGEQPEPHVAIGARQDHGETVCYVRDNGAGIDPQYHERIFGLFEKLDSKSAGTGIGLALVKRIIEVHGGRIWVESEGIGQGSTFCFILPPRKQAATPPG